MPLTLTTPSLRLGQYALDVLLAVVTLFIGWLIWSFIIWGRGQTPGMQIVHIRVIKKETLAPVTWGTMALREIVGKWLIIGLIGWFTAIGGIVLDFMLLWDKDRQQLWDKVASTIVIDGDPAPAGEHPQALPSAA
jgi:uncharacterized RDD family membrane protein YckC